MPEGSEGERIGLNPAVELLSKLLDPESLHKLWLHLLRFVPKRVLESDSLRTETRFGSLRSPVGLAAGYDKTGRYATYLSRLGFGYIVLGSVTLRERHGNPKPRVAYRPRELAVVNAMGLPNPGIKRFLENLRLSKDCKYLVSITGDSVEEFLEAYSLVQDVVDGVEVNISCPTQDACIGMKRVEVIRSLAGGLRSLKRKPVYLKVPPPSNEDELKEIVGLARAWVDLGMDGVTAVNTLLVNAPELAVGKGGLSGRPLKPMMLKTVKALRDGLGDGPEIHAVGGIMTGRDAAEALMAGANTIQIMTAILYRGPYAAVKIAGELLEHLHFR